MFGMLKIYLQTVMEIANFTSPKSRIALQVARKGPLVVLFIETKKVSNFAADQRMY